MLFHLKNMFKKLYTDIKNTIQIKKNSSKIKKNVIFLYKENEKILRILTKFKSRQFPWEKKTTYKEIDPHIKQNLSLLIELEKKNIDTEIELKLNNIKTYSEEEQKKIFCSFTKTNILLLQRNYKKNYILQAKKDIINQINNLLDDAQNLLNNNKITENSTEEIAIFLENRKKIKQLQAKYDELILLSNQIEEEEEEDKKEEEKDAKQED